MHDDARPGVQPHHAEPPRQALAEKRIVAVPQHRFGDELAKTGLYAPFERVRETAMTHLPRRILNGAAFATARKLESPLRSSGGETQHYAAA